MFCLPFMERTYVIGGGSIGLLFCASIRIAFPSFPITLLLRDHHRSRIIYNKKKSHIVVCLFQQRQQKQHNEKVTFIHSTTTSQQTSTTPPHRRSPTRGPRIVPIPAELLPVENNKTSNTKVRPIQNLIVTTKAYDATNAIRSILPRLNPKSKIILLCNGVLAVQEELKKELKQQQQEFGNETEILLAFTTNGCYQKHDQQQASISVVGDDDDDDDINNINNMYGIVHAGIGVTRIQDHKTIASLFDLSGLNCESISKEKMHIQLWQKLAANCVINPLTTIFKCTNGEIALMQKHQQPQPLPSIDEIIQEVSDVALAAMHQQQQNSTFWNNTESKTEAGTEERDEVDVSFSLSPKQLKLFVDQVINDTANNKSSMYQDLYGNSDNKGVASTGNIGNGKPIQVDSKGKTKKFVKTEIDYLNGYIVQMGKQYNIPTPANLIVFEKIHQLCALTNNCSRNN